MTFIADDTIDESCGDAVVFVTTMMKGHVDEKVVGLNDEKEVEAGVVSSSELLQSLHDTLVYCEYESMCCKCLRL